MKYISLFLLIFAPLSTSFGEAENSCFNAISNHVREAVAHNKSVTPIYEELSDGRSLLLSKSLIISEEISLLFLKKMDREARVYQEKGIPLLCEEIADMKNIPLFLNSSSLELRPRQLFGYNQKKFNQQLKSLLKNNQIDKAYEVTARDLVSLEDYPNQLCLTRHFLESIARTLLLTAKHREGAKQSGLPDPINIIKQFITIQRRALPIANYLDKKAFPLQAKGLLIYCQDVPAIYWK